MNIAEVIATVSVYNPFRKNYSKMIHSICDEVEEKRIVEIMFRLPQEERDNILLELQAESLSTIFD